MNHILDKLICIRYIIVYPDNILIFTKTQCTYWLLNCAVLKILQKYKLYLHKSKCIFEQPYIEYLGHVIGNSEVCMDPSKIADVAEWQEPKNLKELQRFLGFCNYYHCFIKDFSKIAQPLYDLTGDVFWDWISAQTKAFKELCHALCSEPILHVSTGNDPFRIEVDSSNYANGGVLSQLIDGK